MILRSGNYVVVEKKKTQAAVFKETEVGDIVECRTMLDEAHGYVNTITFLNHTKGLAVDRDQTTMSKNLDKLTLVIAE
ncbi:hypothetical protein [Peribacillus muralis]|uniref:hypothetical protein n=1 Tax=Peribacillus muralis TaxID=264697 RepID=UPI00366FF93A